MRAFILTLLLAAPSLAFVTRPGGISSRGSAVSTQAPARTAGPFALFGGGSEEEQARRDAKGFRSAAAGSRTVELMKNSFNPTAQGAASVGLVLKEGRGGAVFIQNVIPGSPAEKAAKKGDLNVGDEVTMMSATFGREMWSTRGVGKQRIDKNIQVRQGNLVSFVLETPDANKDAVLAKMEKARATRMAKQDELQKQLLAEKEEEQRNGKKGGFFGLF